MNIKTPGVRLLVIPMVSMTIACGGAPTGSRSETPAVASAAAAGQSGSTAGRQAQLTPLTPDQLAIAFRAAETFERGIPRDTFDPKTITEGLGRDPHKVFEWVRDRTYWVPYRGALRGPVGVLMDRLGNSLDRSLLLAEMLRDTGRTVRLAHATLSEPRAREVLAQRGPPPERPLPSDTKSADDVDREVIRVAAAFGLNPDQLRAETRQASTQTEHSMQELATRLVAQGPFLADQVGGPESSTDADTKASASVRDHWWVQADQSGRWIDYDPLLGRTGTTGAGPQPDRTAAFDQATGRIPVSDEDAHTITIRVIVEQWTAAGLVEKTALDHRLRPAELFGQPVSLLHLPLAWPAVSALVSSPNQLDTVKAAVLKQTEWVPILQIGDKSVIQKSFKDTGELNDRPGNKPSLMGGTRAKSPLGGFGGALGGDEPEVAPAGHLTAEWIEYEIRSPGERPRTVRRQIFDVLTVPRNGQPIAEPAADDAIRTARAFGAVGTIDILPVVAQLSRPYVQSLTLGSLSKHGKSLAALAQRRSSADIAGAAEEAGRIRTTNDLLLKLAMARFDWNPFRADVYIDAPNILTYRRTLTADGGSGLVIREGFDIAANHVAVKSSSLLTTFATRVAQGIVDTNAEELLMRDAGHDNAGALLAAMPSAEQWMIIRHPSDLPATTGGWSVQLRNHAATAAGSGLVVIAPRRARPDDTATLRAFWTVDPITGDTVGIGDAGWGQSTAEYAAAIAVGVSLSVMSAGICELILPNRYQPSSTTICFNPLGILVSVVLNLTTPTLSLGPPPSPSGPPQRGGGGWRRRK